MYGNPDRTWTSPRAEVRKSGPDRTSPQAEARKNGPDLTWASQQTVARKTGPDLDLALRRQNRTGPHQDRTSPRSGTDGAPVEFPDVPVLAYVDDISSSPPCSAAVAAIA